MYIFNTQIVCKLFASCLQAVYKLFAKLLTKTMEIALGSVKESILVLGAVFGATILAICLDNGAESLFSTGTAGTVEMTRERLCEIYEQFKGGER